MIEAIQVVLPEAKNAKAQRAQSSRHLPISLAVPRDLSAPVRAACSWYVPARGTSVPEAAVNEDRELRFRKQKVRIPEHFSIARGPAVEAGADQGESEALLCGPIPRSSYGPHYT